MFTDTGIVWQVQVVHRAGERFDDSLLLTRAQWRDYAREIARLKIERRGRLRIATMDDFGYFPISPEFKCVCNDAWDEYVEANVRNRSIVEIWRDPGMFHAFRNKETKLTGDCAKCPKAAECRAGCSAAALSTTGKLTDNLFCVRQIETEQILKAFVC